MSYSEHFCRSLCIVVHEYNHKHVKTADLEWHVFFFIRHLFVEDLICASGSQKFYYMWHHLGKPSLWRDKNYRLWSDAMRFAQRLFRAWTFCHTWTSSENNLLVSCTIWKQSMNINIWKRLILESTVCSSISKVFPDGITYIIFRSYTIL